MKLQKGEVMARFRSKSERETEEIGKQFAHSAKKGDFIALFGEMGSGKTVFVRGFVNSLIPDARVSSPTYAVLNVYEGQSVFVNHFDMYRVTSEDDLLSTGYEEVIYDGITLCEWPENILEFLPNRYLKISFSKPSDSERVLEAEWIEK